MQDKPLHLLEMKLIRGIELKILVNIIYIF